MTGERSAQAEGEAHREKITRGRRKGEVFRGRSVGEVVSCNGKKTGLKEDSMLEELIGPEGEAGARKGDGCEGKFHSMEGPREEAQKTDWFRENL